MHSIEKIFLVIHRFIHDYVRTIEMIHESSQSNILLIELGHEKFYLPAIWNDYSKQADELQRDLQREIRHFAQSRRNEICKGIQTNSNQFSINNQYLFNEEFQSRLEQIQSKISHPNIPRIRMIINDFNIYHEIQIDQTFSNKTFRLLPVVKHIEKQLYCLSKTLQKLLDDHSTFIENHFHKLQQKLRIYNQTMQSKLSEYISRDIRPAVLILPCPETRHSPDNLFF